MQGSIRNHPHKITNKNHVVTQPLTCAQIRPLGYWSQTLHAAKAPISFESEDFGRRLNKKVFEQLDPLKVLFTQKKLRSLQKVVKVAWKQALESQDCKGFEPLLAKELPLAFAKAIETLSQNRSKLESYSVGNEKTDEFSERYSEFAETDEELQGRLLEFAKTHLGNTSVALLTNYQHDRFYYLKESLSQIYFEKETAIPLLLSKAMLGSFDPYSSYFSDEEFQTFSDELTGSSIGLGVVVRKVPQGLFIDKVMEGSAADKLGRLKEGDIILSVDGRVVDSLKEREASNLLKTEDSKPVSLLVERNSAFFMKKFSVTLRKEPFRLDEGKIDWHFSKGLNQSKVAIVQVPSFYGASGSIQNPTSSSAEDLGNILQSIQQDSKCGSLVLDLRGNPGGYLEEAVKMAGFFIGSKPVVGIVENNQKQILKSSTPPQLFDKPLVVLVDEQSASAAEVLAGALKDYQRAILVGTAHTYGKGSIQRMYRLSENLPLDLAKKLGVGTVKLTTSYFYSPLGYSPAVSGVTTHINLDPEKVEKPTHGEFLTGWSPQVAPLISKEEVLELREKRDEARIRVASLKLKSTERKGKQNGTDPHLEEAVSIAEDSAELAHYLANRQK